MVNVHELFIVHRFFRTLVSQLITGYLPSVVLMLFLYLVPPTMMLFSAIEGPISRSGRKTSACCKVLYFTIWNVFFVNVLSGSVISQINTISSPKTIPMQLAKAVPRQVSIIFLIPIPLFLIRRNLPDSLLSTHR